jgi:hypothetical protein
MSAFAAQPWHLPQSTSSLASRGSPVVTTYASGLPSYISHRSLMSYIDLPQAPGVWLRPSVLRHYAVLEAQRQRMRVDGCVRQRRCQRMSTERKGIREVHRPQRGPNKDRRRGKEVGWPQHCSSAAELAVAASTAAWLNLPRSSHRQAPGLGFWTSSSPDWHQVIVCGSLKRQRNAVLTTTLVTVG